jgi:hypothetical protein
LRVFENRMLNKLLGPEREREREVIGRWRKLDHKENNNLFS